MLDAGVVLGQELAGEIPQRGDHRLVAGRPVELIELPRRQVAPAPVDRTTQLLNQAGLADTGETVDEHERRGS